MLGHVVMIASLCALAGAASEDGSLRIESAVNARQVTAGEVFQLDVIVTVRAQQPLGELSLPDLTAFDVMRQGRSQSTSFSTAGGQRSLSTVYRYTYMLRAQTAGTSTIGEASARLGKAVARAAPVKITVAPGKGGGTLPSRKASRRDGATAYLQVMFDRADAFVGQQVVLTAEVLTQMPLDVWPRIPSLKPQGFWVETLEQPGRTGAPTQRVVNGETYYVYLVEKDAVFPLNAGPQTIPAMTLAISPAGSFFTKPRDITLTSDAIKLVVKPLPSDGRPAAFSEDNVGDLRLTVQVKPLSTTVNQPLTVTLTASGQGNLDHIKLPTWDVSPPNARVFAPTMRVERDEGEGVVSGRVIAEMLVQPTAVGELRIPPFSLWMFSPTSARYRESRSDPVVVQVHESNGVPGGNGARPSAPAGRQVIARGARPIHTGLRAPPLQNGDALLALGGGALLAGAITCAIGTRRQRRATSVSGKKIAAQKTRSATLAGAVERGDLTAVARVILDALANRFGDDLRGMQAHDLQRALASRGLEADEALRVRRFIEDLEAARYAPGATPARDRLLRDAPFLMTSIEGTTNPAGARPSSGSGSTSGGSSPSSPSRPSPARASGSKSSPRAPSAAAKKPLSKPGEAP